eukprot:TRINITY_DN4395_c0_g1_i1.p1 TRINITY_DN4395_c0_g1~~TRINITY_DN4395_c0_g1_i1.p1  ORF type:complete len:76 (+),score=5.20 TRINITY_DN4395_c0_g1_i1:379-606(+)
MQKLVENDFFKMVTWCEKRSCSITLISNKDEFNQVVHMILCDSPPGCDKKRSKCSSRDFQKSFSLLWIYISKRFF